MRLWDLAGERELRKFDGHTHEVYAVAFTDGKRAVSGSGNDRTVRLWDVATGKEVRQFQGHANAIIGLAFTPDSEKHVLSGSSLYQTQDKIVRLWNVETGQEVRAWGAGFTESVGRLAFAPDGRGALTGGSGAALRFWKWSY